MAHAILRLAALAALLTLTAACASKGIVTSSIGASATAEQYLGYIRRENGLAPSLPDPRLEKAAAQQARLMAQAGRMVHTTGHGRDFARRMRENDVKGAAAENIAHGRMELPKLFQMWVDSPSHRRNMLDPRFQRFGLASAADAEGRRYWALVLGE